MRRTLFVAGILLLLGALGAALLGRDTVRRAPAGALAGSSWEEGPDGGAVFYRLVSRLHARTARWTGSLVRLPAGGTLVVLDPARPLGPMEEQQVLFHAEAGGTVLWVGERPPEALEARGLEVRDVLLPQASRPLIPSVLVDPSAALEARSTVLVVPRPGTVGLYGAPHGARVALVGMGRGRVLLVTDPYILSNDGIRRDGNLRFAWRLAHALPEPVWFDEFHHGFETRRGLFAYLRFRGLLPAVALGLCGVLLAGWRVLTDPRWLPVAPLRRGPPGPAALVGGLARGLQRAGALTLARDLLRREARRRGRPVPEEASLLGLARLLDGGPGPDRPPTSSYLGDDHVTT